MTPSRAGTWPMSPSCCLPVLPQQVYGPHPRPFPRAYQGNLPESIASEKDVYSKRSKPWKVDWENGCRHIWCWSERGNDTSRGLVQRGKIAPVSRKPWHLGNPNNCMVGLFCHWKEARSREICKWADKMVQSIKGAFHKTWWLEFNPWDPHGKRRENQLPIAALLFIHGIMACAYMCARTHVHIHTCVRTCIHTHTYTHVCTCVYTQVYRYTRVHTNMHLNK